MGAASPFLVRAARVAAAACAVAAVLLYVAVALARIGYPFELEWMEGASADHVARVLQGRTLYPPPSLEFVPMNYPPLYSFVAAGVARVTGLGLFPLRLVSFLASLGGLAALFVIARRETGTVQGGLLAMGLLAATYRLSGAWLDIARVDSLFLFLLLTAIALAQGGDEAEQIAGGVCLALAFMTKQSAVAAVPVMLVWLLPGRRRTAFVVTAVTASALVTLLLHRVYGDWYYYYVYELPARHAWSARLGLSFVARDLLRPLPVACVLALVPAWLAWRRRGANGPGDAVFLYALAIGCVGISALARMQPGGWNNVLLPGYAALALLFAVGAERLARTPAGVWLAAACILQLLVLAYDPGKQLPSARDRAAGDTLVTRLAAIRGDVWLPYHGYLATLAGKRSYAHIWGVDDVIDHDPRRGPALRADVVDALRRRRFSAVVMESDMIETKSWLWTEVERDYRPGPAISADRSALWPVTGMRTRPEQVYVAR